MINQINLSIDDISPHPKSSVKVLDRCYELIEKYPHIKFSLFIPMAFRVMGEQEYRIDKDKKFCDVMLSLPDKNFELGWHGFNHNVPNEIGNKDREFRVLNYKETEAIFNKMYEVAENANLKDKFKPIFRPPAFKISSDAEQYCNDNNIAVSFRSDVNVIPTVNRLRLHKQTNVLYHACEWDRCYLSKKLANELDKFISCNLEKMSFVFMNEGT